MSTKLKKRSKNLKDYFDLQTKNILLLEKKFGVAIMTKPGMSLEKLTIIKIIGKIIGLI